MKKHIAYPLFFILCSLLVACERVIDIKVDDATGKLVIEGQINDSSPQQEIKLSRNIPLSSTDHPPAVTNALVLVRDEAKNEHVFHQTSPGIYTAQNFKGVPGTKYSLEIHVDNQTYTAQSKIPQVVTLDSITAEVPEFGDKDTRNIKVFYKDPIDQQNQYRFIVFINGTQTKDIFAVNDDFTNGNDVSITLRPNDVEIKSGDTIRVEMLCIDRPMYRYWYTLMQQSMGGGITPSNPPTNITPSVFGYFSAHSISSRSLVIK